MVFIYLLEGHHTFLPKVERILQRIDSRGDTLATSVFTLGEVLTGPRRAGSSDLEASIKSYFASGRVAILPFDAEIADRRANDRDETVASTRDDGGQLSRRSYPLSRNIAVSASRTYRRHD